MSYFGPDFFEESVQKTGLNRITNPPDIATLVPDFFPSGNKPIIPDAKKLRVDLEVLPVIKLYPREFQHSTQDADSSSVQNICDSA